MKGEDNKVQHFAMHKQQAFRKFHIINEYGIGKTYYVNTSEFQQSGEVALSKILVHLSAKGLEIQKKKFYLSKLEVIIQPFAQCKVMIGALDSTEIQVETYPADKQTSQIFAQNQKSKIKDKKQKIDKLYHQTHIQSNEDSKNEHLVFQQEEALFDAQQQVDVGQRKEGIGKAIKAVKIWRELHTSKKCNLQEAANVVGIPKENIEEYYAALRVGQMLGFDFANNLNNKMSDLRSFIQQNMDKITGKYRKNVECFKLIQSANLDQLLSDYQAGSATVFRLKK